MRRRWGWWRERRKYGFDEREMWNVDKTVFMFLYERLKRFDEGSPVDTSYHKQEYNGKVATLQDGLNRMIELSGNLAKRDLSTGEESLYSEIDELFNLLSTWILYI